MPSSDIRTGAALGAYRIIAALGSGGMGEVWRAEDTRLGRHVALKLLPAEFARQPDRLARFEREARVLASLNHPNIATLYGLETATPTGSETGTAAIPFLVMELVEGQGLDEVMARGPMPLEEALPVALQITEALEAAHEAGIVHRDLKPANIKIRTNGAVKVLDFGLAKAWQAETGDSAPSLSPTLTRHATIEGVILGTPAYMSPEQARGLAVDRRTDIWAFGVIVWELLTGRRLFNGDTVTDVLAAVVRQEIDLGALPAATPAKLRWMVSRCLERDPRLRLRDIGEARVAISTSTSVEAAHVEPVGPRTGTRRAPALWVGSIAATAVIGLAVGTLLSRRLETAPQPSGGRSRTFVLPSAGRTIDDSQAISPDGRRVAYTANGKLWIRDFRELEAREVPDSEGALRPFWSPRSDAVAFAAGDALFSFSVQGGRPLELCRYSGGIFTGGSWSAIEGIVFSLSRANWDGDVLRVPEEGGDPATFTSVDRDAGERRLHAPHFLPDGKSLLYTLVSRDANGGEIALGRDGVRTVLGLGNRSTHPAWSPSGHIVFTRTSGPDAALWAVPFSLDSMSLQGEPFRIVAGGALANVAEDRTLVYGLLKPEPQQLVWVDRAGTQIGAVGEPLQGTIWSPAISPDGSRVAATLDSERISVWEVDRGVRTRVTSENETALFAEWAPGGHDLAYVLLGGGGALVVRRADGSGDARVLLRKERMAAPSFSADGAYVAFHVVDPTTGRDLWAAAVDKPDEPFLLLRTPANEALPRISPDGDFVAYQADASGSWEVFMRPFPHGEGQWQISAGGGEYPEWSPLGNELFFVSGDNLMVVDVTVRPEVRVGTPRRLFSGEALGTRLSMPRNVERFYDVAPDGRRLVVVKGVDRGTSDVVVAEGLLEAAGPRGR